MLFSKLIVAAVLSLITTVTSQVVVTVTETVTVVTVTVTPMTTSTTTKWVTISNSPPSTTTTKPITITSTTTVTVAPPSTTTAITTCPIPLYYQCGGINWKGCTRCAAGASCVAANDYYYQCQASTPGVITVTSTSYGIYH